MAAAAPQPSTGSPRIHEEVLVLFGSQTGNSEAAAKEIAASIPNHLNPSKIAECDGPPNLTVTARCMQLDDFLEFEKAKWPRLVVIVTSSYGVGHAPIGCAKFRDVCEEWLERHDCGTDEPQRDKVLEGVSFAMLGLGDSNYSTYFCNPTILENALTTVGATRVGPLGKADASGTGDDEQGKVVDQWIEGIWKELAMVVAKDPPSDELLKVAQEKTWKLCLELFKEWKPTNYFVIAMMFLPAMGVLAGVIFYYISRVV